MGFGPSPIRTSSRSVPSDDELMSLPDYGCKRELLNGEIVMSPRRVRAQTPHHAICSRSGTAHLSAKARRAL